MQSDNPLLALLKTGVITALLLGLACAVMVCSTANELMVAALGLGCLATVSVPLFFSRDYSLFEPATFVVMLVLFGTPLKLLYIIAVQHENFYVSQRLLNWESPDVFLKPLVIIAVGWLFFTFGYMLRLPSRSVQFIYLPQVKSWNQGRLGAILLTLLALSSVFLLVFMVQVGVNFSNLDNLSAKRFAEGDGGSAGRIHSSAYYMYRGAALSKFVVYFSLAWMLCRRDRPFSWTGILFAISTMQTILLSFVISNRAGIVLLMIDCLVLAFYLKGQIRLRSVVIGVCLVFSLLIPVLISRSKSSTNLGQVLEKTLAGRDMLDVAKTCHIINAIPEKMEYRYGEMLYGWMAAPIPRSAWPNKPMWAERGVFINTHVFGDRGGISGVPPGLLAELYWNFGIGGTWIGLFLFGVLLKQLFNAFRPHTQNPTSLLIYILIATRFCMFSFGNDFGTGIVKTVLDLVPVLMVIAIIGVMRKETNEDIDDELEIPQNSIELANA
jgi:oligosaccharide repeat unit polymerase